MRRVITCLCAFAFSQTVLASDARTVLQPIDNSCGSWVEARQKNQKQIQLWYIGFISGRENPLKNIVEGSGDLFIELKKN